MAKLAKIEKVDPREVWADEAKGFTPWLEDNIDQLGDALGMDLQSQAREVSVGVYRLDLLARDKDEHRKALDFLNNRTGEATQFFGVALELWKIGTSDPALKFDLIVTPKDWDPKIQSCAETGLGKRYRAFFQPVLDTLHREHQFSRREARKTSWYLFSAAPGLGASFGVSFARDGRPRVEIYIDKGDKDWNKRLFDYLEERREKIEPKVNGNFVWERLNARRACRISTVRQGSINDDDETLQEIREWMIDRLLAFKRVFGPILAELAEQEV